LFDKPRIVYIIGLLWLALSTFFIFWGVYSFTIVIDIPNWDLAAGGSDILPSILHFGYTMSTIAWFVFSSLFIVFAYGTVRGDHWVWSTGLIFSTIFLALFGLMLTAFMINAVAYPNIFSVGGLITTIIAFLIDLGIVFFLTRPNAKIYFGEIK